MNGRLEQLAHNASEVVSRMDDDELAMMLDVLAVVLVCRGVFPRRGFGQCASELRARADRLPPIAAPIHSDDCGPSPGS